MSKVVRIVETGEVFRSASECAVVLGVSTCAVVHCLKGRRKTVAGCTVRYEPGLYFNPVSRPRKMVRDDTGKWYSSYTAIGIVFGLTRHKARTMTINNGGVFPTKKEVKKHVGDLFR